MKSLSYHLYEASLPGRENAHQLVVAIRQKCSIEEVLNILSDLPNPDNENDMIEMTYNPLKIDVFVQTLLNLGSKSFSHSFAAIAKFHQVFKVSFFLKPIFTFIPSNQKQQLHIEFANFVVRFPRPDHC